MQKKLTVKVPGTSANIGPGFDCLGIALQIYNSFQFTWENIEYTVSPKEQYDRLAITFPAELPMMEAYVKYCEVFDIDLPLLQSVKSVRNDVPVARGLGSSATCYVAGARAAQWVAEQLYTKEEILGEILHHSIDPFSKEALLRVSTIQEKHPDNVCPAIFGGLQFSTTLTESETLEVLHQQYEVDDSLRFIIAYPNFTLKTSDSRAVLPEKLKREDCIFNMRAITFLLKGFETGNAEFLKIGLQDRIHQSYRSRLIKGYDKVTTTAINAGAFGSVLSGAGPSIMTVCEASREEEILKMMREEIDQSWEIFSLETDLKGFTDDEE